ncbi:Tn7-like element transposition protein TnsE [Niallia circulans]|uniref:Tn7-like element transposition protein TnsE n=1 Tax=Niallia circulans TaxID=1397 RepID=UPI0035236CAB
MPIGDGNRVFSYLEDGITPRRYALATVSPFNGNEFKILEVERENRALSMLILSSTVSVNWNQLIDGLLLNLVNSSGTWEKQSIQSLDRRNVMVQKANHSKKEYKHRAKLLINKTI